MNANTKRPGKRLCALALAASFLPGCTLQQILIGQWYRIVTPSSGGCPSLQWQFVVDAQRSFSGFVSPDGQRRIAYLSGRLNQDDSFQMTATAASGGGTANVAGRFTADISTISISGSGLGSACSGQTFLLRLGSYFARQGGGGGGGES